MIRALFWRGLRQHLGLLAILSLGLVLFEWAIVWVAARMGMGSGFRDLLATLLPPDMLDPILGQFGLASFGGTLSFGYQHPLSLIAAIAMVTVMATIPAHERETGLVDLILSRPLTRSRYLTGHVLLVFVAAMLPPLALLAGGALGLAVTEAPETVVWSRYIPSAGSLALLLLAIGAYVLLFSTGAKRRGTAVAQAVGITLVFYWLDFMGDYWDLLETARYLSPFYYFDPAVAANSGLPSRDLAVLLSVSALGTAGALLNFRKQDL